MSRAPRRAYGLLATCTGCIKSCTHATPAVFGSVSSQSSANRMSPVSAYISCVSHISGRIQSCHIASSNSSMFAGYAAGVAGVMLCLWPFYTSSPEIGTRHRAGLLHMSGTFRTYILDYAAYLWLSVLSISIVGIGRLSVVIL